MTQLEKLQDMAEQASEALDDANDQGVTGAKIDALKKAATAADNAVNAAIQTGLDENDPVFKEALTSLDNISADIAKKKAALDGVSASLNDLTEKLQAVKGLLK